MTPTKIGKHKVMYKNKIIEDRLPTKPNIARVDCYIYFNYYRENRFINVKTIAEMICVPIKSECLS